MLSRVKNHSANITCDYGGCAAPLWLDDRRTATPPLCKGSVGPKGERPRGSAGFILRPVPGPWIALLPAIAARVGSWASAHGKHPAPAAPQTRLGVTSLRRSTDGDRARRAHSLAAGRGRGRPPCALPPDTAACRRGDTGWPAARTQKVLWNS